MIRYKNPDKVVLQVNPGVNPITLHPEIIWSMGFVADIYEEMEGKDLIITAVIDGEHKEGSKHYVGRAFDGRTKNLNNPFLVVDIIKKRIEVRYPKRFRVLYEGHGTPNAHLHVQLI